MMEKSYTILAVQRVPKPSHIPNPGYPYYFLTRATMRVSPTQLKAIADGDSEELEDLLGRFRAHGVAGETLITVAMGGRGVLAARMKKLVDWKGTGMPKIWEGTI